MSANSLATPNETPQYTFLGGFGDDLEPSLEVVKSWSAGQQSLLVSTYDTLEAAFAAERELVEIDETQGLEAAMQHAERLALGGRHLDPARPDGQLFTAGPPDPFTTLRDAEIAGIEYTYDIVPQPQGTYELQSLKIWQGASGSGLQSLSIGEYDRIADARSEQALLRDVGRRQGQQTEMRAVERLAVENDALHADRVDPRLFSQGPPDPFTTLRQAELAANFGYTFRAGPALAAADTAHSLDFVYVERDGIDYHVSTTEILRVASTDADYIDEAAAKFNRMLGDEGPLVTAQAAATWARDHGMTPAMNWQSVDLAPLDQRELPAGAGSSLVTGDTEPLPTVSKDWEW